MKNSCKVILLSFILALASACSKSPGKTNSKVKIVSGNFAAILSSKANNGLFFYGRSTDGKVFTKKVDTDTIDLIFPNGTWNFYAISYELASPPAAGVLPNFTGKTYCGKTTATLNGTDASIQIDLTNAGCNDPAFSNNVVYDAAEYKLPRVEVLNCKSLAGITSMYSCDDSSSTKFNKGYASSYRIIALEQKNFGDPTPPAKIAQSGCIINSYTSGAGFAADSSVTSNIRIPTVPNGIMLAMEVFYSNGTSPMATTGCDGSQGVDIVPLSDNPRMKLGMDVSTLPRTAQFFVKTDAGDVCRDVRLSDTAFASGNGYPGNPYTVCTKNQLNLMRTNYSAYQVSSISLLTDIDYAMANIQPIGPALADAGGSTGTPDGYGYNAAYLPKFNGNGHRISNFIIDCKTPTGTAPNYDVGFFRKISKGTISNLIFNNAVVFCDEGDNVGVLSGKIDATSPVTIENVKVHGHADGRSNIGALVGYWSGQGGDLSMVHVRGDFGGKSNIGGLVGYFAVNSNSTINRASFFGSLYGNKDGFGTPQISNVGGLFGLASTSSGAITINQSLVKGKRLEASSVVGGFVGDATNLTLNNSYSEGVLVASGSTDGTSTYAKIGGAIGAASSVSMTNTIVVNTFKRSNRMTNDHSLGGLVGFGSTINLTNAYYTGDHDASNPASCTPSNCGTSMTFAQARTQSFYSGLGFTIPTKMGSWDTVNNLPTLSSSCSPSEMGKYYEASNINPSSIFGYVLPGDIILCNGSLNELVPMTSIEDKFTNDPYTWKMDDDGYDTPRLSWEQKFENDVPYLKRECRGHYASVYGTGTSADPKWICSYDQFTAMSPGQYYVLKKDIVMSAAGHTPLPAGQYFLDGNGYSLKGFIITLPGSFTGGSSYYGIFSNISSGSVISNLNIISSGIISNATPTSSGTNTLYVGMFAGNNAGSISNVIMDNITIPFLFNPVTSDSVFLGGAFGFNSGSVVKMEVSSDVTVSGPVYSTASSQNIQAGGVVGRNMGTMDGIRSHASIGRRLVCTTPSSQLVFGTAERLGGFAGLSAGTLRSIDHDGELRAEYTLTSSFNNCTFVLGTNTTPFVGLSTGVLTDFTVNPRLWFSNTPNNYVEILGSGSSGTIARGFVEYESNLSFAFLQGMTFTAMGDWDPSASPSGVPLDCPAASAGQWYNIIAASPGSNSLGVPMVIGDRVVCNGSKNVLLSNTDFARISGTPPTMTDVLTIVRDPGGSCSNPIYFSSSECTSNSGSWSSGTSPTLPLGRYYDKNLLYSVGTGLKVETVSPSAVVFDHNTWSVATDFMNPGTKTWALWFKPGQSVSSEAPELVKTAGGLDGLGPAF